MRNIGPDDNLALRVAFYDRENIAGIMCSHAHSSATGHNLAHQGVCNDDGGFCARTASTWSLLVPFFYAVWNLGQLECPTA